jgi:hypothetical protein
LCEEIDAPDHFFPLGRRFSSLLLAAQGGEREIVREREREVRWERQSAPDHFFPLGRRFSSLLLAAQGERERERVRER